MKRYLQGIVCTLLLWSLSSSVIFAHSVPMNNPHYSAYTELVARGAVAQNRLPYEAVTRGEVAMMLVRAKQLGEVTTPQQAMEIAIANQFFTGYADGSYGTHDAITRAQMATVIVRAYGLQAHSTMPAQDVAIDSTHYEAIRILYAYAITTGTSATTFSPNAPVQRVEVASFIYRTEQALSSRSSSSHVTTRVAAIQQAWFNWRPTYRGAPFATLPNTTPSYRLGSLQQPLLTDARNLTNFLRFIADVPSDVRLSNTYNVYAQAAAVVNAANQSITHTPTKPPNMSQSLFEQGRSGSATSNLARKIPNLLVAMAYGFMNDGDAQNMPHVGHRLWMLSPFVDEVGFGQALDTNGNMYAAMRVTDEQKQQRQYREEAITWPGQVAMPTQFFTATFPWSVSLNPQLYKKQNVEQIRVTLTNETTKEAWFFSNQQQNLSVSTHDYGGLSFSVIFRPNVKQYTAGHTYRVTIAGLQTHTGQYTTYQYTTTFFGLAGYSFPQQ